MWFFVAGLWIVMVAAIFWAYGRKRKQALSARAKELEALISGAKGGALPPDLPQAAAPVSDAKPVVAVVAEKYSKKPRLLEKADALLYLLLRSGLPDHEIFARLSLLDVVEPGASLHGFEREQSIRRLSQSMVDFVVCNKQLEIVAAVLYAATDASTAEMRRATETCLRAAGIRIVTIDPAALPRHHQVRALIYGDDPPSAT